MKTYTKVILLILGLASTVPATQAQTTQYDTPETLNWIQRQASRVDTVLYGAVISQEPVNLLLKLWWAWQEFDAIAQAGVYCQAARVAAEKGRLECDLLGYERDQDVNAMLVRATEARRYAHKMRLAAAACATETTASTPSAAPSFTPRDVLLADAGIIELDLSDAQASHDMHIIAQKLEHSQRLLRDMRQIAQSLDNCTGVVQSTQTLVQLSQDALNSNRWQEATQYLEQGLKQLPLLRQAIVKCQ